ncbi:GtrA family protein [Aquipuribacter nitratireducens]|uniref:GtrA family protein n=1 Tax=Aquipuribacter nitratireducens TaxID=650104 RepID=A0ABW0GL44_9MICO
MLRRLYGTIHGALALVVREAMKFGVVGAVAYVVDLGVFNLLVHVGSDPVLQERPLTGKVVSVCVATLVAWLGNRYWTFRRRRRSAVPRELFLFAVVNVGGLLLALVPLAVSRYVLGLTSALADNIAANVVGLALGTLFRFVMYRTVVFTELREGEPGAAPAVVEGAAAVSPGADPEPGSQAGSAQRGSRFSTKAAMPSTRSGPPTT